jgi:2-keto-4-pentenoate hydratase/2-oxohepta-3-ene-1,7-dioic acid hydratase in catechol pathway
VIRNLYFVGRNYIDHAKELGNAIPTEPLIFTKPVSSLIRSGENILLPTNSQNVQHECEIVISIGKKISNATEKEVMTAIDCMAIGIDVTARDLQDLEKKNGHSWFLSKCQKTFSVVGNSVPISFTDLNKNLQFQLKVNGELRQKGEAKDMFFGFTKIVSYLSSLVVLQEGDLIFTGTPAGVARLQEGDVLEAEIIGTEAHLRVGVKSAGALNSPTPVK